MIKTPGNYTVTITDACSNMSEYTFTIEKSNTAIVVTVAVIGALATVGTGVFFIIKRKLA